MKKVYFAGKVKKEGFRQQLMRKRIMSERAGSVVCVNGGVLIYAGPNAISDDHGCWHGEDNQSTFVHGVSYIDSQKSIFNYKDNFQETYTSCEYGEIGDDAPLSNLDVTKRCFWQIDNCDAVYAYIDSPDCYGTLVELGYANAKNKPIYLVFPDSFDSVHEDGYDNLYRDFWFVRSLSSVKRIDFHKASEPIPFPDELLYFEPKYSVKDILKKIKRTTYNEDELKSLGMIISKEYQKKKGEKPFKKNIQNNGVEVPVNQYTEKDIKWIEDILKQHTKPDYLTICLEFINAIKPDYIEPLTKDAPESHLQSQLEKIQNYIEEMTDNVGYVKWKMTDIVDKFEDLVNSEDPLFDSFNEVRQYFK